MISRCLALGIFALVTACAAPAPSPNTVEPVLEQVFEAATPAKSNDPCETTGDGIGGTGCPIQ